MIPPVRTRRVTWISGDHGTTMSSMCMWKAPRVPSPRARRGSSFRKLRTRSGLKPGAKRDVKTKSPMTRTPKDLFLDQLRDLHSVETQLLDSLPVLAARADYTRLYGQIASHAIQSVGHLE